MIVLPVPNIDTAPVENWSSSYRNTLSMGSLFFGTIIQNLETRIRRVSILQALCSSEDEMLV